MSNDLFNAEITEERALYRQDPVTLDSCRVAASSEYALLECHNIQAKSCAIGSRYALWLDGNVGLEDCELTADCRSAIWYSRNVSVVRSKLHGEKSVRECSNVVMRECDINSSEFGWNIRGLRLTDSTACGEHFLRYADNIAVRRLEFKGRYAFQYANDGIIMDSKIDSVDALWNSNGITLENCVLVGERLGWFSKKLTLKNCTVIGARPFCYCSKVRLIDCVMQRTEDAFEQSEVYAVLRGEIDSIKNPYKGVIKAPNVGKITRDDPLAKCRVLVDPLLMRGRHEK